MTVNKKVKLNSFNCHGLCDRKKRIGIFYWLEQSHSGITALQETHSTPVDEQIWQKEWNGKIYYSHGKSNSSDVAILIPDNILPDIEITDIKFDQNGRLIVLDCEICRNPFVIICVYFPTKDKQIQQLEFLSYFKSLVNEHLGKNLLICGDFNICLNLKIDKKGGNKETESRYARELKCFMEEVDIVDIWRLRHPDLLQYSRRENSRSGLVQSRIDFWLVSTALEYQVGLTTIKPGNNSDHSVISISLELLDTQMRGKGFWKFNNNLLTDCIYIDIIKQVLKDIKKNVVMENKSQLWEFVKCKIRSETIAYSIQRSKKNKLKEIELLKTLENLEKSIGTDCSQVDQYRKAKQEWEDFQKLKLKGSILRSKAQWVKKENKTVNFS